MARFQINPGLEGDGAIEFEMTSDDGASTVKTRLSAADQQALVDLLAQVRMMTPNAIAEEPQEGVVQATVNPAWRSPPYRAPQGRVLILRHPGLGWQHYIFPEDKAQQLAQLLTVDLTMTPPPSDALN